LFLVSILSVAHYALCNISKLVIRGRAQRDVNPLVKTPGYQHIRRRHVKQLTIFNEHSLYLRTQTGGIIWHYKGVLVWPKWE